MAANDREISGPSVSSTRLAWLAAAAALGWLALLLPALVHFEGLLSHEYKFLSSWVLGRPRFSRQAALVDGLSYTGCMLALLVVWLAALRVAAVAGTDARPRRVAWVAALGFAALGFLQVPFTSADPFYYRGVGLVVAAGDNPYVGPVEREVPFTEPPMKSQRHPPLWGPPMLWLFGAAVALAGPGVVAGLYALKLSVVLFHLLNVWLVGRIAREIDPPRETWALVFYGWSPLFVFEHAGIGHNDPPMLTALLVSIWLVHRGRISAACVAVAAGVAFKAPAALAALPLALYALLRDGRAAWWPLARGGLLGLALLALLYAPFWAGTETFAGLLGFRWAYFGSLPQLPRLLAGLPALPSADGPAALERVFEAFWLAAFVLGCGVLARWLALRRGALGAADHAAALGAVYLLYLLTQQRYFWSWYASWAVVFAALAGPHAALVRAALALALGCMLGSAVYRFVPPIASFTPRVQLTAIALSFGPVLLVVLFDWARGRRTRS